MRIIHVNDIAFVGRGLVREQRALGIDSRLVEPWRPGASIRYPWKLVTLPLRALGLAVTGLRLRIIGPDLVHAHYARLAIVGPLSGCPYVVHCHGTDIREVTPGSPWGRLVGPMLRHAALVYYSTPDLRTWVEAFRPDAVFLPNPIDTGRFVPVASPSPGERDLLVGVRLDAPKGLDDVIATVRAVLALRPRTRVTVVEQGTGLERFRAAIAGDVEYLAPVAHEKIAGLMQRHRVAVGQFRVGAIGNYELEALACGLPVAAAFRYPEAYGAPPPLIAGSDPDGIGASIATLLDDEPARRALAAAARSWVAANHGAEAIAARVVEDYRAILGEV